MDTGVPLLKRGRLQCERRNRPIDFEQYRNPARPRDCLLTIPNGQDQTILALQAAGNLEPASRYAKDTGSVMTCPSQVSKRKATEQLSRLHLTSGDQLAPCSTDPLSWIDSLQGIRDIKGLYGLPHLAINLWTIGVLTLGATIINLPMAFIDHSLTPLWIAVCANFCFITFFVRTRVSLECFFSAALR